MHTLNTRQLRALAIVAPGTLAISDDSTLLSMIFQTTEDDRIRSGIETIEVYQSGNVTLHMGNGVARMNTYGDLIRHDEEARAEEAAFLDDFVSAICD